MKVLAAVLAAATLYVGIHFGSTVAGGADSYGYVSEAGLWRQRHLTIQHDIARASPWPIAVETWAPVGFRPAAGARDAVVPVYPPGLPLLMALFQAIGGFCAAFVVVPLSGALTVALTYAMGQRAFQKARVSLAAAVLIATSPIFMYQLMNPMSDVPVTAAWMASLYLACTGSPLAAGLVGGAGLLIRPNLVLMPFAIGIWLAVTHGRLIRFAAGLMPAIVAIAAVNAALYGNPLTSGYGDAADLYAVAYSATNLRQFSLWMMQTQWPTVIAAAAYFVLPNWIEVTKIPRSRLLFDIVILAVFASYVFYIPFDAWWYLRFLLPAWPLMMLAAAAFLELVLRGLTPRVGGVALTLATGVLAFHGIAVAAQRHAFDVGRAERRYIDIARFVAAHTDSNAVIFAVQHSGTLRMYAGRLTLRFDQLDGAWLDRTVSFLQESGRHPFFVLEADERTLFRNRFGASNVFGRLDWQPMASFANPPIDIFDPLNRGTDPPLAIGASASRTIGWRCDPPQTWPTPLRVK